MHNLFSVLRRRPLVSICVPAYKSQPFIGACLESALGQTVDDIEIIISNDGGYSIPALDTYRPHPKIRVWEQRKQLGWVGNSNFVLSKARGAYFMILPHDDQLKPTYVERCLGVLKQHPGTFAVNSDINIGSTVWESSSVTGPLEARIEYVMRDLFNGYSYRALMRRRPGDWRWLKMIPNPPTDFCVDTTWILQQACFGELRRVPEPLYRKYHSSETISGRWSSLSHMELRQAWETHCKQMGRIVKRVLKNRAKAEELIAHRRDARRVRETPPYLKQAMK